MNQDYQIKIAVLAVRIKALGDWSVKIGKNTYSCRNGDVYENDKTISLKKVTKILFERIE